MSVNPFFELYVGERISSQQFVTIFSPYLVEHAGALFQPGNLVVKGIQGSGKSMLFKLLKPEVRVEYAISEVGFPIPRDARNFIAAGINLTHSNAMDFGYRKIGEDANETALLFGDFINYAIALDLLNTVACLGKAPSSVVNELKLDLSSKNQEKLATLISKNDCWNDYLAESTSVDKIKNKMSRRLQHYRSYLHLNVNEFDAEIKTTKTPIGVPISALSKALKEAQIIPENTNIFIHIDQYEELANIATVAGFEPDYRAVINRAMARRDPQVSYRIGSRGYAWYQHGKVFGGTANLEQERDYKFLDLDSLLRKAEHQSGKLFEGFAEDVLRRRLSHSDISVPRAPASRLLEYVFGKSLSYAEKAVQYVKSKYIAAYKADSKWSQDLRKALDNLAKDSPVDARYAEAWVRQGKGEDEIVRGRKPWNKKPYWKKEREEIASLQIASANQQRPIWSGAKDILDLSGGNILTFLSLCQIIWDLDIRMRPDNKKNRPEFPINEYVQSLGVTKTSNYWVQKIGQETSKSSQRQRFVQIMGEHLSKRLMSDRSLSYPGHNGFSITKDLLFSYPTIRSFLEELSDYGNMICSDHTTKEKDRRQRFKCYPSPILCPSLRLPYKRAKEPLYINNIDEIAHWVISAGVIIPPDEYTYNSLKSLKRKSKDKSSSLPLFSEEDE